MNWSDKARQIAEELCDVESLSGMDIESFIIYDEDGRIDLRYLRELILPMVVKAAVQGMAFECDNWLFNKK